MDLSVCFRKDTGNCTQGQTFSERGLLNGTGLAELTAQSVLFFSYLLVMFSATI